MKFALVFATLLVVALARPQRGGGGNDADATVARYDNNNDGTGNYQYAYETSNGIAANEDGEVKNLGPEDQPVVVRGSFSFVGPDGVTYKVDYIADENGFQPQGAHIPQAP